MCGSNVMVGVLLSAVANPLASAGIPATGLPFSPFRLALLVGWLYLCLYFVQRVQYSALIPIRFRTAAKIATFFTGPLVLGTAVVIAAVQHSIRTGQSVIEVLGEYTQGFITGVRRMGAFGKGEAEPLKLLDSSGRSLDEVYGHGGKRSASNRTLKKTEEMIENALNRRASDILIDPRDEDIYSIRFRIDGMLQVVDELDDETSKALINSIKAISSMDIAERRRPQDGAFIAKRGDENASFRVASAGALNGEKLSIRVLNQNASRFTLDDTGLSRKQINVLREAIKAPSGMILVCGPTGSGKTTTLYALLNEMDRYTRNVITVEDPIEAVLPEASQIEINAKADITFAKALRSILRQDPDVICVGEIRDEETAEIALRASQTGHLVLATMHCDSNAAAIVRLLDLGISPMLLASGLSVVYSQRLLRCLCESCKEPAELSSAKIREYRRLNIDHSQISGPAGCDDCEQTGYYGRTAVGHLSVLTDTLKQSLTKGGSFVDELRSSGTQKGRSNLGKQALQKVVSGASSLEELKRVIG